MTERKEDGGAILKVLPLLKNINEEQATVRGRGDKRDAGETERMQKDVRGEVRRSGKG